MLISRVPATFFNEFKYNELPLIRKVFDTHLIQALSSLCATLDDGMNVGVVFSNDSDSLVSLATQLRKKKGQRSIFVPGNRHGMSFRIAIKPGDESSKLRCHSVVYEHAIRK